MITFATRRLPKAQARTAMQIGRFIARLKKAPLLEDIGMPNQLPPGEDVPIYPVDMLPGCPESWVRGPGSYVCPVEPNWGLWFDWTENDDVNTAVLASVRGVNPITGQKLDGLRLESYVKKCPVHKTPFKGDKLFCPECGYKWPPQNYVCHPNTLWWDGFRKSDGTVRQFFFTEDEARDIPSLLIGKENVVPAFGFVFYEPKKRREVQTDKKRGLIFGSSVCGFELPKEYYYVAPNLAGQITVKSKQSLSAPPIKTCDGEGYFFNDCSISETTETKGSGGGTSYYACAPGAAAEEISEVRASCMSDSLSDKEVKTSGSILRGVNAKSFKSAEPAPESLKKDVSVGAGAEIMQNLECDPLGARKWKPKPAALMRLYFVFEPQFNEIAKKGIVDLDGNPDGFLKGLPVGG